MPKYFTLLMLFISLSVSGATNIRKNHDDVPMEVTCLGKYTGVFHSFIYFAGNETDENYYMIRTPWLLTYPSKLKSKLTAANMTMFDKNPAGTNCGWTLRARITDIGVSTGYMYTKSTEVQTVSDTATHILSNTYPLLEILLIVIPVIVIMLVVLGLYIYYQMSAYNSYTRA